MRPLRTAAWIAFLGVGCLAIGSMDARVRGLLLNSFKLGGAAALLAVPLGTALALVLLKTNVALRRTMLVLLAGLLFVPLYLQAGAWDAGFGLQGWFTYAYGGMGSPPLIAGWRGAIFIQTVAALPWVVVIVGAGLRQIPPELEEEAVIDGGAWQAAWRVTLPAVAGWIGAAAVWTVVTSAAEMTVTDIYQIRTYTEELYTGFALSDSSLPPAGVWPGAVLVALSSAAALWMCSRLAPRSDWPSERRRLRYALEKIRLPVTVLGFLTVLFLAGVPLGNLVFKSGVVVEQVGARHERHWSAGRALESIGVQSAEHADELLWSLVIATITAIVVVALAAPVAWLARRDHVRSWPALAISAAGLAVPAPMIGLGVIALMNRPGMPWLTFLYDRTVVPPCLALVVRTLPVAILVLWYAVRSLPESPLEAAATEGAGPISRWWHIGLPQRAGALAVAALVTFALALGDLAASILVLPPGMTTLAVQVFQLIHYGVEDEVAALCLATLALYAAVAAIVLVVARRWRSAFSRPQN